MMIRLVSDGTLPGCPLLGWRGGATRAGLRAAPALAALVMLAIGFLGTAAIAMPPQPIRDALAAAGRADEIVVIWPDLSDLSRDAFRGPGSVYFLVREMPAERRLTLPRLHSPVRFAWRMPVAGETTESLRRLDNHEYARPASAYTAKDILPLSQSPSEWTIALPERLALPAVVALDLFEAPIPGADAGPVTPAGDGSIVLPAHRGMPHGEKLQYEPQWHKNTLGYWVNADDWAEWSFQTDNPGENEGPRRDYAVHVLQGCGAGQGGSRVRISVEDASLDFDVIETGHFQNFVWRRVGTLPITSASTHRLELRPLQKAKAAVMDIRQIRLVPLGSESRTPARDISEVPVDVRIPPLVTGDPAAGRRVIQTTPGYEGTDAYHTIYLPTDWQPDRRFPVLVEWAGNGPFKNEIGDTNTGRVEDAEMGIGISGGHGWVWVSLPYLNQRGTANVSWWWGDPSTYDDQATLRYCRATIEHVCHSLQGDAERVVLCGFSRGAIACNRLGLADDETARLWRAFVAYSHYDGVSERWPFPAADRLSARKRLERLDGRPQFLCAEIPTAATSPSLLEATREYLEQTLDAVNQATDPRVLVPTGFRNHDDAWLLRPSPARDALREWLARVTK